MTTSTGWTAAFAQHERRVELNAAGRTLGTMTGELPQETCPFGNDECADYDCTDCENERALQDDYDASAD